MLKSKCNGRCRNTFTATSGSQLFKSIFAKPASKKPTEIQQTSLEQSEKTYLMLKLLEKCSQQVFAQKQNDHNETIKIQDSFISILEKIKPQAVQQSMNLGQLKGSDRFLYLDGLKKSSQNLISSWTAFQHLDITYKTKYQQLLKENVTMKTKLDQLENKMKFLYVFLDQKNILTNKQGQDLNQSNLGNIQARIEKHKKDIEKIKVKLRKKQNDANQFNQLLTNLLKVTFQKYGPQVDQRVKRFFMKQNKIEANQLF